MTRTLFVGDLHAKPWLLTPIARTADREHADRIILLGDVCDDWNLSDRGQESWATLFATWVGEQREHRETVVLLGNHDVPYWIRRDTAAWARIRRMAPGFHPGAWRIVHESLHGIGMRVAWSDGTVLATHAGVLCAWEERHGLDTEDPNGLALVLDSMLMDDDALTALYREIGPARGGDGIPGPLWADLTEFAVDGDRRFTQIIGHTPVPTVTWSHGAWCCDTFSTRSDGLPLGDRGMLLMDDDEGTPAFRLVWAP